MQPTHTRAETERFLDYRGNLAIVFILCSPFVTALTIFFEENYKTI